MSQTPKSNRKLLIMLILGSIGMFGFGFALVPLYEVLCDTLGINGKTQNTGCKMTRMNGNDLMILKPETKTHAPGTTRQPLAPRIRHQYNRTPEETSCQKRGKHAMNQTNP